MADALIHRRADALREPAVSKGRRVGTSINDHLMNCPVDFICRHGGQMGTQRFHKLILVDMNNPLQNTEEN